METKSIILEIYGDQVKTYKVPIVITDLTRTQADEYAARMEEGTDYRFVMKFNGKLIQYQPNI